MAPLPAPLELIVEIFEPEQILCNAGVLLAGAELVLTVTADVIAVPEHPLAVGVMVKVVVADELDVLVSAPVILPEPLDAMPVSDEVLFLVHA